MVCFLHYAGKDLGMKKTSKFLWAVGAAAAVGITIYAIRRHRANREHKHLSNEGYETAHDILYPEKKSFGKKLHFGPVLPE